MALRPVAMTGRLEGHLRRLPSQLTVTLSTRETLADPRPLARTQPSDSRPDTLGSRPWLARTSNRRPLRDMPPLRGDMASPRRLEVAHRRP